jgi:hypothetical protein
MDDPLKGLAEALAEIGAPTVYLGRAPWASVEPPAASAMLSLNEAAAILGYKPAGLRKIVAATKEGKPGPSICFAQVGKGPIRFRREWLDEFINANIVKRSPKPQPKRKAKSNPVEPQHGFDNRYFKN